MQADEGGWRFPAHGEQLIPGIPNDITLNHVTPKLPWRVFHILSSVSPAWLRAIRSHQVYDARARSHATETLILMTLRGANANVVIHLYSMRDNSCSQLPPLPNVPEGIPRYCQSVLVDGTIYVLGGRKGCTPFINKPIAEVYVFDLAGQRQWMECARMKEPRESFGCGVLDGKIYVFGGESSSGSISGSEVYDPKGNIWSSISPMVSLRFQHFVAAMGEELFVNGGLFYNQIGSLRYGPTENRVTDLGHGDARRIRIGCARGFLEVYHPIKDEWRLVKSSEMCGQSFMAQGKLHYIDEEDGIKVFDVFHSLWSYVHSVSFARTGRVGSGDSEEVDMFHIHAVDGELLALAYSKKRRRCFLFRSIGLGTENKEIVFQETQISSPSGESLLTHESWHPFSVALNWMSHIKL